MPTEKYRLTIVLEHEQMALLRRVSSALDQTMSHTVAEVLDVCAPVFEQMAEVLEAKKRAEEQDRLRDLAANRDLVLLGHRAVRRKRKMRRRAFAQWRDFVKIARALLKKLEVTPDGVAGGAGVGGGTPKRSPARPRPPRASGAQEGGQTAEQPSLPFT